MELVARFTVADVSKVLDQATEANYISQNQAAQLAGLFIATEMMRNDELSQKLGDQGLDELMREFKTADERKGRD